MCRLPAGAAAFYISARDERDHPPRTGRAAHATLLLAVECTATRAGRRLGGAGRPREGTHMNMTALNAHPRHAIPPSSSSCWRLAGLAAYALPGAQAPAKKALTIDDYTKWRSIAGQKTLGRTGSGPPTSLALTNTIAAEAKPVLHILNLETGADVTVDATRPDADFLARLDVGIAYTGGSGRGAARASEPERRVRHAPAGGGE